MANTRAPQEIVEQSKSIPLLYQWASRDISNTKDTNSVNIIWDIISDPNGTYYEAMKRDGYSNFTTDTLPPSEILGMYYWTVVGGPSSTNDKYICFAGAFGAYLYSSEGVLVAFDSSLSFNNDIVRFTEFQYEDKTSDLIITDGQTIAKLSRLGVLTQITSPNLPSLVQPYVVYLDGYLFVAGYDGTIYNSNNNDPTTFSASGFIYAESYPDAIRAIARLGVYLVAFGTRSIQFFYDAGNPTGTPLAPYSASVPLYGFREGLVSFGDTLVFIASKVNGTPSIFSLEGFKLTDIGNSTVSRRLQEFNNPLPTFYRSGHILNLNGHTLYTWNDYSLGGPQPYNSVYAVDLETKLWTELKTADGLPFTLRSSASYISNTEFNSVFNFIGSNQPLKFSPFLFQDKGANFTCSFTTKNEDFGNRRTKFGSRLMLNGDQLPSPSYCYVSWSDDDYQTFSTPRAIDMSSKYNVLYALGSFRRRAHKITYSDNFPMRWVNIELDYVQGQA